MKDILVLLTMIMVFGCQKDNIPSQIKKVTSSMEKSWRGDNKPGIAEAYSDDTYVISMRGIEAHGREEINAYWRDFNGRPIDWRLFSYLISKKLDDIYQSDRWKARKRPMPHWSDYNVTLPADPIFQYGQSMLVGEKGSSIDTSTVEFLLVWQNTATGWKIFVDAYN